MRQESQPLPVEGDNIDVTIPASSEPESTSSSVSSDQSSPLSCDPQPAELLQYLHHYRAVVCVACQYAVQPNAISRHLKEIHRMQRSRRRPFMQYVSHLHLDKPHHVIQAKILQFPVPWLPVLDGLQCNDDGCFHLCASTKRMRMHWISNHGRSGQEILDWHSVPLQTFFRGNLLHYFTDSLAINHTSEENDMDYLDYGTVVAVENGGETSTSISENLPSFSKSIHLSTLHKSDTILLQHFISSTCITLATNAETKVLWKTVVPQIAIRTPFLMHGILACAALHLACIDPVQQGELIIKATNHQDSAMPIFRCAIANVSEENCDAIYIFCHLLVIYSFATEKLDDHLLFVDPSGPDVLPSWLFFLRNTCSMVCTVWDRLNSGSVKSLVAFWAKPVPASEDSETHLINYFLAIIPSPTPKPISDEHVWPGEVCRIYHEAALELVEAFSCVHSLGDRLTFWDSLRVWPMRITVEYLDLLSSDHPGALILLAHYCILLQKLESHWYFQGRATRLLSTVLHRLDTRWHDCIKWPLEEVGIYSCS